MTPIPGMCIKPSYFTLVSANSLGQSIDVVGAFTSIFQDFIFANLLDIPLELFCFFKMVFDRTLRLFKKDY
jgi:hypothetical protein